LGVGFAAGFGLPRWMLSFLKKRREKKFLNNFPDGVDVIVRGIKAGLPLLDSLKIIARDAQEPIKSGFRCPRPTSSASSFRFSRRPAATCPRRSETCPGCCATARR